MPNKLLSVDAELEKCQLKGVEVNSLLKIWRQTRQQNGHLKLGC